MVGRRGPAQAAFTTPELHELGELAGADVIVDPADLEGAEPTDTNSERNLEVLREYAARTPEGSRGRVVLRFLRSPVALQGDERVEAVELVRNRLEPDGRGGLRAVATDEHETLPCRHRLPQRRLPRRRAAGRPFDERAARSATSAAACSTKPASKCRASTPRAGSSAAPPA